MPIFELLREPGARIARAVVAVAARYGRSVVFVSLCVIEGVFGFVLLLLLWIQNT